MCIRDRVRIVEDEAEQGGGGDVGPVGLGIGGRALALALIGHEDTAGHTCVVDAVQRHIGSREGQELLADGLHVLVRVEAEEAQVDGGVGGMTARAGVRIDDGRIGGDVYKRQGSSSASRSAKFSLHSAATTAPSSR